MEYLVEDLIKLDLLLINELHLLLVFGRLRLGLEVQLVIKLV